MAGKMERKSTARRYEVSSGSMFNLGGVIPDETLSAVQDIGAQLSRINHRLFRQGRQYKVRVSADPKSFGDNTSTIGVWALAPTWYVNAAWRKAKAAYDGAMSDEKKVLAEQNLARWRDFRVSAGISYLGVDAVELGGTKPVLQVMGDLNIPPTDTEFTAGEFNLATAKNLDTGVAMSFTWGTGTSTKFGILEEYTRTRNESASPDTVITQMPYDSLLAEGEDMDYQELQANGNEPPYNADAFGSNVWCLVGTLSPADLGSKTTGYFTAPCGLVVIRNSFNDGTAGTTPLGLVSVEVAEGDYHGVHAPAM